MKRVLLLMVAAIGIAAFATSLAGGGTGSAVVAKVTIRPELIGCHSWSVNDGPYASSQIVQLRQGQSIQVVNRDICSHTLAQGSGGRLTMSSFETQTPLMPATATSIDRVLPKPGPVETGGGPISTPVAGEMAHFGAGTTVTFLDPGTYTLTTSEGASYFPGAATVGADNQLTLNVEVIPRTHQVMP